MEIYYSGEALKVLGKLHVKVEYGMQHAMLPLYVVAWDGPSLLGCRGGIEFSKVIRHVRI
jgi:hypothetical protein